MKFGFGGRSVTVNIADWAALSAEVLRRFRAGEGFALATINLDHLVKLRRSPEFLAAYEGQDLVVADGWPIVWLSRLAGRPVDLMPGSDSILPLCRLAAQAGVQVALIGSTQKALDGAARVLSEEVPGLEISLRHAPAGLFDPTGDEADAILHQLNASEVGLCFLALGAPKQETLAARGRRIAPHVGFASIGAGLDFLSGDQKRAPQWVRRIAMEWLWRALSSPMRLGPRYLRCILILPRQVLAALLLRFS